MSTVREVLGGLKWVSGRQHRTGWWARVAGVPQLPGAGVPGVHPQWGVGASAVRRTGLERFGRAHLL